MAQNGRLPDSTLAEIPGGRLTKDAAASSNRSAMPMYANVQPAHPDCNRRKHAKLPDEVEEVMTYPREWTTPSK